jgi:glycyl-tRNA synthetase beta chain
MRTHQKYFSLFQQTKFFGKGGVPLGISEEEFFAPFFLFVSNIKSPDDDKNNEDLVVKGNQKVLSARLSDALYFYQQDLKKPLLDSLNKLDKVVFHTKLGSMKQKTDRLVKLTKYITSDFQQKEVEEAALLCKGDLVSEMVGEFPELQGIMGYYYALKSGKSQEIASAIRDHYKPQGPSDNVPEGAAAIVAVADKIDSLCGLMLAGERATGSGDPFGLRRLALGIIRILSFENEKDGGIKGSIHSLGILNLVNSSCHRYQDVVNYKKEDENQIINFVEERYKHYLKEQGHTINQINAVIDFRKNDNLLCLRRNLLSLKDFLQSEDGERLLNSYKRINNILSNQSPVGEIDKHLFNKYEKDLFEFVDNESKSISMSNFYISLKTISNLKPIIDSFFDNVMVMDSDAKIANNRLLLLARTKQLFNKVANFDLL